VRGVPRGEFKTTGAIRYGWNATTWRTITRQSRFYVGLNSMQTVFSTDGLPHREAYDYWMDVAAIRFAPHQTWRPQDRLHFSGTLRAEGLSDLEMLHWRMAPGSGASGDTSDDLMLMLPRSRAGLEFADDSFEMSAGNVYLLDRRAPYWVCLLDEPSEHVAVRIPRLVLARRLKGSLAKVVNRPVPLVGDAALLAEQVRAVVRTGPSTLSPAAAVAARMHFLDLTALALAPLTGKPPRLGASAHMVALMLKAAIDAQFANPAADRASICAAAGVSERHANRILAQEGTSVIHLLHERRLEKCRLALEKTDRAIAEIAYSCGYADASHFARVFRARYGVTPREHRVSAR
jgi:AraC family transcriptional regulator, positive regulator of tynA and feaB